MKMEKETRKRKDQRKRKQKKEKKNEKGEKKKEDMAACRLFCYGLWCVFATRG